MAEYRIVLESPLGERHGTLTLHGQRELRGSFTLLGNENPVTGTRQGEQLTLRHPLRTLLNTLACKTEIQLCENSLTGTVRAGCVCMPLRGELTGKEDAADGTAE